MWKSQRKPGEQNRLVSHVCNMYFTVETHPSYMRGERVAFKHTTCMPAPPPSRQREGRRRDVIQQWKLMRAPSCGKIWQYSKPVSFIQEGRGGCTQQAGRPLAWLNTIRISFFFLMNLNYLTKYYIEHHNWNSQKGRLFHNKLFICFGYSVFGIFGMTWQNREGQPVSKLLSI